MVIRGELKDIGSYTFVTFPFHTLKDSERKIIIIIKKILLENIFDHC